MTSSYSKSLLKNMTFVKRRGSTAAKITPAVFEVSFLADVCMKVSDGNIPDSLIFNWDQTGLQLVPTSEWTMELSGSQRVSIAGSENKKEITALICVSVTGAVLPPQLCKKVKPSVVIPNLTFLPSGMYGIHLTIGLMSRQF